MSSRSRRGRFVGLALALFAPERARADEPPKPAPATTPATAPARGADAVVLRDGTRVEGRIVEQAPTRYVVLKEPDGRRRMFVWEVVREVDLAPQPAPAPSEHVEPARPIRKAGFALGYEVRAELVGAWTPLADYPLTGTCTSPGVGATTVDKYGQSGSARESGVGGGLGARVSAAYLSPPEPSVRAWWWSVEATSGLHVAALRVRAPTGIPAVSGDTCSKVQNSDHEVAFDTRAATLVSVPLALGPRVGLGGFRDDATWRGVAVGLAWSPALVFLDGRSSVLPLGVELAVDVTTLRARPPTILPKDAHVRLSVGARAPAGGAASVTFGLGIVWY